MSIKETLSEEDINETPKIHQFNALKDQIPTKLEYSKYDSELNK